MAALADAGHWSEANMSGAPADGPELFVATNKDWKQRKAMREAPAPRGRIPEDMTVRERMERKLLTQRGRALYKLRGQTIEPTFWQIKDGRGCDGFSRRGEGGADFGRDDDRHVDFCSGLRVNDAAPTDFYAVRRFVQQAQVAFFCILDPPNIPI